MIQDIAPYVLDNQYTPDLPNKDSFLLCFHGNEVLINISDDHIVFPRLKDLESMEENLQEGCTYLFSINSQSFYLANNIANSPGTGFTMANVEIFRTAQPQYLAFAGITAFQIFSWYQTRRFCGRCGKPMKHHDKERMMFCSECGLQEYPKLSPAVIVGIVDGNKLLMSRYSGRNYKKYALIAGFAEVGETIEETVKREVMEEVGLKVKNIRYYKSQPWAFSSTLLFGFYADLDGAKDITLDRNELEFAEWFNREDIPVCDTAISLTNEMIMRFRENKE